MPIDFQRIRYRGDEQDVKELFETYRIKDYLDAYDENRRQHEQGVRGELLKRGILLTENLSPRVFGIFREVAERLQLRGKEEIVCLPDPQINAFALLDIQESGTYSLVGITTSALERLEDDELKSVFGHELGHFVFGNNRLNALISNDQNNPSATVLPAMGEALFLRWRKKAELSADRVGLLASGDFQASVTSLMKTTFGLSEKNLNLDIEALLRQVEQMRDKPELVAEAFASHPLLPVRLKALQLFAGSEKARSAGIKVAKKPLGDDDLENAVDELVRLTQRRPRTLLDQAAAKTLALSGALLLSEDGDVNNEEIKILIHFLHDSFTDEPETEIITDRKTILRELPKAMSVVREKGDHGHKSFIVSRLADIALADGALLDIESSVILKVAEGLGLSEREAWGVIMGAAQAVGFKTDRKLNRIAENLRRSLQIGFQPPGRA